MIRFAQGPVLLDHGPEPEQEHDPRRARDRAADPAQQDEHPAGADRGRPREAASPSESSDNASMSRETTSTSNLPSDARRMMLPRVLDFVESMNNLYHGGSFLLCQMLAQAVVSAADSHPGLYGRLLQMAADRASVFLDPTMEIGVVLTEDPALILSRLVARAHEISLEVDAPTEPCASPTSPEDDQATVMMTHGRRGGSQGGGKRGVGQGNWYAPRLNQNNQKMPGRKRLGRRSAEPPLLP